MMRASSRLLVALLAACALAFGACSQPADSSADVAPSADPPRRVGPEGAEDGGLPADTADAEASDAGDAAVKPDIVRKVMVIDFDPVLTTRGGMKISQARGWLDPKTEMQHVAEWFVSTTRGRFGFEIVSHQTVNEFPLLTGGFRYTESGYLAVLADPSKARRPDGADYNAILTRFKACEALNAGTIDELWLIGGPWYGYYESRLAGPNAFFYNAPVLTGTTCARLMPIMGFNPEAGFANAIHDFGHRTESTMAFVYGGWSQNSLASAWDRFGLVASQSPAFGFSGCGTTHRPPNALQDYEYDATRSTSSTCGEFGKYPNMLPAGQSLQPVTCAAWGCTDLGYYEWWFRQLPRKAGVGPDGKTMDWLRAAMDPNHAL